MHPELAGTVLKWAQDLPAVLWLFHICCCRMLSSHNWQVAGAGAEHRKKCRAVQVEERGEDKRGLVGLMLPVAQCRTAQHPDGESNAACMPVQG